MLLAFLYPLLILVTVAGVLAIVGVSDIAGVPALDGVPAIAGVPAVLSFLQFCIPVAMLASLVLLVSSDGRTDRRV
jgi:hypothetical protein